MPILIENNNYTNPYGYSGATYVSNAGDTSILTLTVAELKEMAKAKGIEGISSMKKADLIAALS